MFDRRETFALFEISLSRYLDSLEEGFHQPVSTSSLRKNSIYAQNTVGIFQMASMSK
jgi:hypothetical protein